MQSQAQTSGPGQPAASASVFAGYAPPSGGFDEMLAPDGATRSAWEALRARLDAIGTAELRRRWARSQRQIRENGVVYSAFGDPAGAHRPWTLDPAPLVLHRSEWVTIAEGLRQRAAVLEAVLQDLYGPQHLVTSGVLPPEMLYRHPGYRFALHRAAASESRPMLHFYAADLGRSADGRWWVLADRTEAPSGVGFALENRVVISRMLPDAFRDLHVERLAPFFVQLREALQRHAPRHTANPRVALLSQGPSHPNYFEDAYLARYLGYLLVEGGDLTVRKRRLWMKTLDGLTPIDVLVRRPNTADCDPLELGGVSPAGVAGLAQSERDGSLLVANALGSGLVESPVFMAFLPRLCQAVLGEPLRTPGVASWWCGEPASLEYVLANVEALVLKRAYRRRGEESLLSGLQAESSPDELRKLIRAEPHAYAAQERVSRSTAPAWAGDRFVPAWVALRAFLVSGSDHYHAMHGALARTTAGAGPLASSGIAAEGSKDVWIIGDEPVTPVTLLPSEAEPIQLVRIGAELPSRVADDSFWLGRYLERADAAARLVRFVAQRLTSGDESADPADLPPLVRALAELGQLAPDHAVPALRDRMPRLELALPDEALDPAQGASLASSVRSLVGVAGQVRDRLSRDTWRLVLRVGERFRTLSHAPDLNDLLNLADELILDLAAIGGMVVESMTRTQFYRFLDLGRRIERAMQTVETLRATLIESDPPSQSLLEALLAIHDSLMTYRSRYRAQVKLAPVLDLLVTDDSNPRSVGYQLNALEWHVAKLPQSRDNGPGDPPEQRVAMRLTHAVRMIDIRQLAEAYELGERDPFAALLDRVGQDLPALADAVALKYLAHSAAPRQLSPT